MKAVIFVTLVALVAVSATESCTGCPEPLDLQEAKQILDSSLTKLATLEGPYYKYVLHLQRAQVVFYTICTISTSRSGTIHSASKQVVAGIIYRINADLIDAENAAEACNIEIFTQPWMSNTVVTFKCPNQDELEKTYND